MGPVEMKKYGPGRGEKKPHAQKPTELKKHGISVEDLKNCLKSTGISIFILLFNSSSFIIS